MATSTTKPNELMRMKAAKKRATDPRNDENPIKDGPNSVLDDKAVELAQQMAEQYGLEKLKKLFPDMAALLEEQTDG